MSFVFDQRLWLQSWGTLKSLLFCWQKGQNLIQQVKTVCMWTRFQSFSSCGHEFSASTWSVEVLLNRKCYRYSVWWFFFLENKTICNSMHSIESVLNSISLWASQSKCLSHEHLQSFGWTTSRRVTSNILHPYLHGCGHNICHAVCLCLFCSACLQSVYRKHHLCYPAFHQATTQDLVFSRQLTAL